ncbi:Regulator of nucleoside diphosphate kinase [Novipirellula galeiformis]|uniref:Regulator of nucleoside diphosphate kinase n=1 Tax=Novipirellula galeiformis TaxID=2528004 RepID=A0A5C6BY31_9BACT|nr:nucleoside diphosphate kinase regulator [Novipirellula galeiformis]TWU17213.1 Regulator of nucleoside diphosphate kinase [Novipirellula galeiformis]
MATKKIVITRNDYERLDKVLASAFTRAISDKTSLKDLRGELDAAKVVESQKVPPDVVTMDSIVKLLDLETKEIETYTLVYPEEANIASGKLSILAPIGTAILGCRTGDVVRWKVPSGECKMRIEEIVFQPERETMPT